jgi:hypothetical protein
MALQLYKIASIELAASSSTITFASIPQGYTDLKVFVSSRQTATEGSNGYYYDITFNGTTANRTGRYLQGNGSVTESGSYSWYSISSASDHTANTFSNSEFYIPNYTSANSKSSSSDSVYENNATASRVHFMAGLWNDTAAITSITFTTAGGSFSQYTTATLYGIL